MERVNNPLPIVSLGVLFFLVLIQHQLPCSNAHIGEWDEYWKSKEAEAKRVLQEAYHPDPYNVTNHLNYHTHLALKKNRNSTRRALAGKYEGPCEATNPIDQCWRCKPDWEKNRKHLADCVLGFGRGTTGGKDGKIYTVTDPSDNDMVNPKPGTLRFAVIQIEPLWIIFARPMNIRLSEELMVNSHKTIDARGSQIHIYGAGITVQFVKNVIIHGLHVHHIVPGKGGMIRDSVNHYGFRTRSDGDAISIFGSSHIWVDHCSLAKATDGLIDVIQGSTAITISNNHMMDHDEVFLFGAHNSNQDDEKMQITVAFNHFGKGLVQRMPRCRWGFVHVVNNDYTHWLMYAIGGSQHPIILSQGNRFIAPPNVLAKEVTKRGAPESDWKHWSWRSENDYFLNGAYFRQSGTRVTSIDALTSVSGKRVGELTHFTGPRKCTPGKKC